MHGAQAFLFHLDSLISGVMNVTVKALLQLPNTIEPVQMEVLGLQIAKKAFHRCIFQTVALVSKALGAKRARYARCW